MFMKITGGHLLKQAFKNNSNAKTCITIEVTESEEIYTVKNSKIFKKNKGKSVRC